MALNKFNSTRVKGKRVIYTASLFARQNLIYLQEIGSSEYLEAYSSNRGELSSYLFFIVKNGIGKLTYHDVTYTLRKGSCVFIYCSYKYTISTDEMLWSLDWIHFNGPTMNTIYEKYVERCGGPCFNAKNIEKIEGCHRRILTTVNTISYVQDMEVMGTITELLTEIMYQCWKETEGLEIKAEQRKWIPVKEYLEEHFNSEIKLDDLSARFSINKFYLLRKFKDNYGVTINQYITKLRITHAKEFLRFSELNVTEVACEVGISDSAYFSRIFKKEEGISPSEFRKQWRNENVKKSQYNPRMSQYSQCNPFFH
mgnify:CR=1 FL=1